jgi:hypothetical protein
VQARLVNRVDAWGEYRPLEEVGKEYVRQDGTKGNLGSQTTRKGTLTLARIRSHFQATNRSHLLGLHPASADNLAKWGALDIDQHGDDPVHAEANRLAALHWYGVLAQMGFHPLLTSSNGKGGYHLRVLLAEAIDAARIHHFLQRLTADPRKAGLCKPPEQFPKQEDLRKCKRKFGNWLRLPGRHHSRDYWSEVWDGSRWLVGKDAVQFMLALTGDDPKLIPEVPLEPVKPQQSSRRVFVLRATNGTCRNLSARIAAYCAKLPNASEGEGRDDIAYRFACWLIRDLAVRDDIALAWLERWDDGNRPAKGRERLSEIIESARAYGQRAIGCGLPPEQPEYDRQGHRILRARAEIY